MYTVLGFDLDFHNFKLQFDSFVGAVKYYRECESCLCCVSMHRTGDIATCSFVV